MKPYFEYTRIATDENTKEEFEYPTMGLWADVSRIEFGVDDGTFNNKTPKTVLFLPDGNIWALAHYEEVKAAWAAWLDENNTVLAFSRS